MRKRQNWYIQSDRGERDRSVFPLEDQDPPRFPLAGSVGWSRQIQVRAVVLVVRLLGEVRLRRVRIV